MESVNAQTVVIADGDTEAQRFVRKRFLGRMIKSHHNGYLNISGEGRAWLKKP